MHDSLLMHVRQCPSDLGNEFPNLALREGDVFLDSFFYQQLQIAFLCPFDGYKKFIELVINEPIEVLDDVGVV